MSFSVTGSDAILVVALGVIVGFTVLYLVVYNAVRSAILDTRMPPVDAATQRRPSVNPGETTRSSP